MVAQPKQACGQPFGQFRPVVEFIPPGSRDFCLRISPVNTMEVCDFDLAGAGPKMEAPHE